MTEDDLLVGLVQGALVSGWRVWHARRSDRAVVMGTQGWPDITALPPKAGPLLVIECKSDHGAVTADQAQWLVGLSRAGVTAGVVRPVDYDRALALILDGNSRAESWDWAFAVGWPTKGVPA